MFKDFKLYSLTSSIELQNLIRDINIKILNKKDVLNELDFNGF
jgi:hypothetical protein